MAQNRIKGITVELNGDVTGIEKALKSVNSTIKTTQSELKDIERLLKLDPSNIHNCENGHHEWKWLGELENKEERFWPYIIRYKVYECTKCGAKQHQTNNDVAVMKAYGMPIKETDEAACVAWLMRLYQEKTAAHKE